jgi:hypothetical protein
MASRQPIGKVVHFDGQEEEQDDLFLDWIFDDPEDGVPSDEHGMAEAEEGRAAKPIKSPSLPSPEEIEAHAVSHTLQAVVLSLCERQRKEFRSSSDRKVYPEEIPVISIDYGFFGAPGQLPSDAVGGAKMPVLVVRDRKSKALFTHLVPSKGVEHFYPEQALCRDVKFLGYPSLVIKSDQEPSFKAAADAVKNAFASSNVRVQLENSPRSPWEIQRGS